MTNHVQIPDAAVQAALDQMHVNGRKYDENDFNNMRCALTSALPHLTLGFATDDLAIVNRMAMRADEFDIADENGSWPDHQDAMATLGELRALRRVLSCLKGVASIDTLTNEGTKPVDVAAVIKPVTNIDYRTPQEVFDIMCDRIRALSAEPAQGEQWQPIDLVGDKKRLIIIGGYNSKGLWCAEVWSTQYLRDQQAKSADGFFMNAPHLEWVPTHFMELPAAPTPEAEA